MMGRGGMPMEWQPVRIQPIYNKRDPLDPNNYRPIAITSILYSLYAGMVTAATDRWAAQHGLIPPEQFGFQRRRSTTQAAFVLRHAVHAQRAARRHGKLHCTGGQCTSCTTGTSAPGGCTRGIKQGCPLSPLLFSLYISVLPNYLQQKCLAEGVGCGDGRLRSLIYADDLSLLSSSQAGLQRMLVALHSCAASKQLAVNVKKTEVMAFGGRRGAQTPYTYVYGPGREQLNRVSEFKVLGLQQAAA